MTTPHGAPRLGSGSAGAPAAGSGVHRPPGSQPGGEQIPTYLSYYRGDPLAVDCPLCKAAAASCCVDTKGRRMVALASHVSRAALELEMRMGLDFRDREAP